jgi:hypothetical protein
MCRVGQNQIYTAYMTVYSVISLPKIPYIQRIYVVLADPMYVRKILFIKLRSKQQAGYQREILLLN